MELSIILPAYNEEDRIRDTITDYDNYFKEKYGNEWELIAVTDGCTDNTPEIVEELSEKISSVKHLNYEHRLGKGGGVLKGFKEGKGDLIGFVDADGAASPNQFDKLLKASLKSDGAIGSRWLPNSVLKPERPLLREVESSAYRALVQRIFKLPFSDFQCGAKIFRRHAIKDVIPETRLMGFAFDLDLLYSLKKKGYEIIEVPIVWRHKGSEINLKRVTFAMAISILELRIFRSRFDNIVDNRLFISLLNSLGMKRRNNL